MITLRFYNLGPPAAADVSGDEFVFETGEVFRLPGRELIARHRSNNWLVDDVTRRRPRLAALPPAQALGKMGTYPIFPI